MANSSSNLPLWESLYDLVDTFSALKPWEYIREYHVFAVQDPESGILNYCSILGYNKEVFALNVYHGEKEFSSYLAMAFGSETPSRMMETGINQDCMMISWEDRNTLTPEDIKQIKDLNRKYRGKNNWVMFRDFSPGLYPWYITEEQAKILVLVLPQAIYVAQHFKSNPDKIGSLLDDEPFLTRIPKGKNKDLEWVSKYQEYDFDDEFELDIILPAPNTFQVNRIKQSYPVDKKFALIVGLFYSPNPIQEHAEQRPSFPRIMVWIDRKSGMVLHFQMFENNEWEGDANAKFFEAMDVIKKIPGFLIVSNELLDDLMSPISDALDIELIFDEEEADEFLAEFQEVLRRGPF